MGAFITAIFIIIALIAAAVLAILLLYPNIFNQASKVCENLVTNATHDQNAANLCVKSPEKSSSSSNFNGFIFGWPNIANAEKVDVDTGTLPTTVDAKGVIHLRGWVKNITLNATDTDFSVEMNFTNGAFLREVFGSVSNPTKMLLVPGETMYWDIAKTNKLYAGEYTMLVRYNEIPFPVTIPAPAPATAKQ